MTHKVIILGSGPAGYTTALYTARANLNPILLCGSQAGGQLMLTRKIENYPGFPEGITGPDLMERMKQQAERYGTKILDEHATSVDFSEIPLKVMVNENVYDAESVAITTGASARWLGLESETKLKGKGVSACATCDGPLFKEKDVVVVGGGDTAVDEALFLTNFVNTVTVVHRRDQLRASRILQERAFRNVKLKFQWNSVIKEIIGTKFVEGVIIQDIETRKISQLDCQGVFVAIGYTPNTEIFGGKVEMDERGYIITKRGTETSAEGVFAAGDVQDPVYRQAVTAAGSGCMAAIDIQKYLQLKRGL